MERKVFIKEKYGIYFLYLIYTVGIIGHSIGSLKPLMLRITPITLFITGFVVLYFSIEKRNYKLLVWCSILYIFTFIVEVLGVKTGLIFGSYNYGEVLGFKLFDVPLIIGFNWVLVILGAVSIAKDIEKNIFLTALLTGVLALIFDILLEPVAIKLGYWSWQNNLIPFQNYLIWFLIAFTSSIFYDVLNEKLNSLIIKHYFLIQILFFMILSLFI